MEQRMVVILEHVMRYHENGNDFLFRIVTMDESWFHHFSPEGHTKGVEKSAITCPKEVQYNFMCRESVPNSFLGPPRSCVAERFGGWNHQC
ncbi:hypothetical protein TNCV_4946981 [Trichonephila clavipes]|nr:hypothetical protein TNCV_4946981 [Trichonephila clavipes]